MTTQLDRILADAVTHGLVDEAVLNSEKTSHPWPVVIMTGLMTFLASIPIFGVLFLVVFDGASHLNSVVPGAIVVACAVGILRIPRLALFAQYLGASLLGSGIVLVMVHFHGAESTAVGGILSLLATMLVPQPWLRIVLASAGVFQLIHASTGNDWFFSGYRQSEWPGVMSHCWYGYSYKQCYR